MWRRTHVNTVPHIFAPFSFDPAILLAVYGAAMFVGRVPTVSVDSSTLHYDEYRVRKWLSREVAVFLELLNKVLTYSWWRSDI